MPARGRDHLRSRRAGAHVALCPMMPVTSLSSPGITVQVDPQSAQRAGAWGSIHRDPRARVKRQPEPARRGPQTSRRAQGAARTLALKDCSRPTRRSARLPRIPGAFRSTTRHGASRDLAKTPRSPSLPPRCPRNNASEHVLARFKQSTPQGWKIDAWSQDVDPKSRLLGTNRFLAEERSLRSGGHGTGSHRTRAAQPGRSRAR